MCSLIRYRWGPGTGRNWMRWAARALIVLTNRDHDREAVGFKERTGAQLVAHEADAPLFDFPIDRTVGDGEEIVPDLRVLHLEHGKSPGRDGADLARWAGGVHRRLCGGARQRAP